MTFAELKRNAASGKMRMELISRYGKTGEEILERIRGIRTVSKVKTTALVLVNKKGEESDLDIRSAKLISCDGKFLTVYAAGERDLTEKERSILSEWNRIEAEYYKENPYGDSYWKMKRFFENCECPWMDGFGTHNGKRYTNGKVVDNSIKGEEILKYRIYMET